jgi:Family of unknown function (DUF5681)
MSTDRKIAATAATDEDGVGYKHPPMKGRFPKGKSGNPFGRRKGQRNMTSVLKEVLQQLVTVKQGDESQRLTKGEALIKVIMSKANNGDRQAIDAVSRLAETIARIDDRNSETSTAGGVMLVPGVANSVEEYKESLAKLRMQREQQDQQRQIDAPKLAKKVISLRETIDRHKGTAEGNAAAAELAQLTSSHEYQFNFHIHKYLTTDIPVVAPPKKEEPAKLPWDADEFVRMPFHARKEYARTHSEDIKPDPRSNWAPGPVHRPISKPGV